MKRQEYTAVVIFGKTYHLRGGGNPERLRRLSRIVDRRMREITPDHASADGMKVALLAAINFADEIDRLRQSHEEKEGRIQAASSRLTAVLADCLEENIEVPEGDALRTLDASPQSQ